MLRSLAVVCVVASISAPVLADAPDLKQQLSQTRRDFMKQMREATNTKQRNAAFNEHQAELRKLAAEGERASPRDHATLATIYSELREWQQSVQHASQALEQGKPNLQMFIYQISGLAAIDDLAAAERALAKAQKELPDSADDLALQELRIDQARINKLLRGDDPKQLDLAAAELKRAREKLASLREKYSGQAATWDGMGRSLDAVEQRIAGIRKRLELVGKPAAEFPKANWVNSSPLTMSGLRGKVVVLDFWAVWCGPCVATFPHLRHWHDKYGSQGLVVVGTTGFYQYGWDDEGKRIQREEGLSHDDELAALEDFLKHHELKHAIAVTEDKDFARFFTVSGIPQAVVIDRAGKVRMIRVGSGDRNAADLEKCIEECLAERPSSDLSAR